MTAEIDLKYIFSFSPIRRNSVRSIKVEYGIIKKSQSSAAGLRVELKAWWTIYLQQSVSHTVGPKSKRSSFRLSPRMRPDRNGRGKEEQHYFS